MVGGELFVPKLPSMNIKDLAQAIAPECRLEIVGIRPGEKLHEVMIPRDDARRTLDFGSYYLIQPDFRFFEHRFKNGRGKPVPEDFEYNSGTNDQWLTSDKLREMIKTL
jgi:UDP-N-acetylglucosamine 4,6-dehydratase